MPPYVLVISPEFGYGGVGVHTQKIVNFLCEEEYIVRVHTTSKGKRAGDTQLEKSLVALQVDSIADPILGLNLFNPLFDLLSVLRQGENPDLIIRPLPIFYFKLPNFRRGGTPELIIVHDTLIDFLNTINNLRNKEIELSEKFLSSFLGMPMLRSEKIFLRKAKKIVAVSCHTKKILSSYYGIGQEKIDVIYNPVDTALFKRKRRSEIKSEIGKRIDTFKGDSLLAAFVGRPYGLKNFGLLARLVEKSYKKFDLKFVVVGIDEGDTYARYYIEKMKRYGVLLTGYIKNNDMPDVYSLSEFLLITSLNENLPTCLLEAMACGTIPISTNVGGIPEAIDDGENGFLVTKSAETNFQCILEKLLNCDRKSLKSISKNAERTAKNSCERELVKKMYLNTINELI